MQSNRLQLNSDKNEVLWCATTRRQHQLPRSPLLVDGTPINPVQSVRDLGIFIDADLVMRTHLQKTVCRYFAVLRQLRSIRHSVPATMFQHPAGIPFLFRRLQYVTCFRFVRYFVQKRGHASPHCGCLRVMPKKKHSRFYVQICRFWCISTLFSIFFVN